MVKKTQVQSWVGKIPWRREWLPTPVFKPGEFHGQRSLVGYSPWDHKESDMTEQLNTHTHTHTESDMTEQLNTHTHTHTHRVRYD